MKNTYLSGALLVFVMFTPGSALSQSPSGWEGNFWLKLCGSNGQLERGLYSAHVAGLRGAFEPAAEQLAQHDPVLKWFQ